MLRLHSFVHKGNSLRMQHSEKHKNKKTHIAHNILALIEVQDHHLMPRRDSFVLLTWAKVLSQLFKMHVHNVNRKMILEA